MGPLAHGSVDPTMPDVPGTDPTPPDADPDAIVRLIRSGADLYNGHLRLIRGSEERWLGVVLDDHGLPKWVPTLTRGVGVGPVVFDKLSRARVIDRLAHVDGERYALVAPNPKAVSQMAILKLRPLSAG